MIMMTTTTMRTGMRTMMNLSRLEVAAVLNHPQHLVLHHPGQDQQAVLKVDQDLPEALPKGLKAAVRVLLLLVQVQHVANPLQPDGHQQANPLPPSQNRKRKMMVQPRFERQRSRSICQFLRIGKQKIGNQQQIGFEVLLMMEMKSVQS